MKLRSNSRRWRWLAALSAMLVAAAVLAPAPAASAQSTTTIWSATLTVDDTGVGAGCDNSDPQQDDCSNALTDSDFTFGGVTYTFESVLWYNEDGLVSVKFDTGSASAHKTALASLTLNLPGAALAIEAANIDTSLNDLSWNYDPNPDWAEGDEITVSLTQPAGSTPTTPTTPAPTTSSEGTSTGKRNIGVDLDTVSGWSIVDGAKKDHVGVIRLLPPPGSIPAKRVTFTVATATYEAAGSTQHEVVFTVGRNGKVSYSGAMLQYETDNITLVVVLSDSKSKAAEVTLNIPITVRQPLPPRIAASGAPYNGWSVTAGEASDNIGTVYGIAFDGDLVKFPRHPKFRYEITQAVDLAKAGDAAGPALLIGSKHAAFKIAKGTGVVSYTGERITGDQVRIKIRVSDKKGLAAPIDVISLVSVTHTATSRPAGTPSRTQPDLRSFAERNPPPAVWRGPVHAACPAKPGYVNFGGSPTVIDLQEPSPAPLLDPAERYVIVPAPCNYVTEEAHREYCAVSRRWWKDFCRGWSPPYTANSES